MSLTMFFTDRQLEFIKIMAEFDNPGVDISIERYLSFCLYEYICQHAHDTKFVENMSQFVSFDPESFVGVFPDMWDTDGLAFPS